MTADHGILGDGRTPARAVRVPVALAFVGSASAALIGIVVALHRSLGASYHDLVADAASAAGKPFYTGFLSNAGIVLWCASASICLFAARVLSGERRLADRRRSLYAAGFLSALLAADDLFMLHESVLPAITGLPEFAGYVGFAILGFAYLASFRREILSSPYAILAVALVALGASVLLDVAPVDGLHGLPEEGVKLVGIVAWFAYMTLSAAETVRASR